MTVSSVTAQPLPVSWMDHAAARCQWSLRCLEPCESCKGWYLNPLQRQTKRTGFSEDPMLTARLREPWRYRSPGGSRKDVQRLPKGYPRDTQGIPKGYPRATQGIPKGYPRDTQGIPKGYSREQQARITGAIPEQPRINAVAVRSCRNLQTRALRPGFRAVWLARFSLLGVALVGHCSGLGSSEER